VCPCHKRPTTEAKETYYRVKRDLLQGQKRPSKEAKRPTTEAKETYNYKDTCSRPLERSHTPISLSLDEDARVYGRRGDQIALKTLDV
jgi:hypothetical protein